MVGFATTSSLLSVGRHYRKRPGSVPPNEDLESLAFTSGGARREDHVGRGPTCCAQSFRRRCAHSAGLYDERWALLVEVVSRTGFQGGAKMYGPARLNAPIVGSMASGSSTRRLCDRGDLADVNARHARTTGRRGSPSSAERHRHRALLGSEGARARPAVHVRMGDDSARSARLRHGLYRSRARRPRSVLREEAAATCGRLLRREARR
jgi:hypothetical protein